MESIIGVIVIILFFTFIFGRTKSNKTNREQEVEEEPTGKKENEPTSKNPASKNEELIPLDPDKLCQAAKTGDLASVKRICDSSNYDVDATSSGLTALMYAAHGGHVSVVQELIRHGANTDLTNDGGWTPLMAAAQQGHVGVVKALLSADVDVSPFDNTGWNALMRAKQGASTKIITALRKAGANLPAGVRWCPGCQNFLRSSSGTLGDHGMQVTVMGGGSRDTCQRCGSVLETV